MSIYQKASLVQIPSGYKAADDKLYSVIPANGDGDFTVSVDADATRVNSDGLIESVSADQARLNYDFDNPQDPHLLLEPTRTNLITRSYEFNTIWAKGGSTTVTTNFSTAPDGTNTASRLQMPSGFGTYLSIAASMSSGTSYSLTFYIKNNGGQALDFGVWELSSGGTKTDSLLVTPTDEWVRYELNFTADSNSNYVFLDNNNNSNSVDCLIWGAQLEAGSYPTSYIPTSGSAVTRTGDDAYQTTTFDLSTNNEYSFYIDVEGTNFTSDFQYLLKIEDGSNGRGFRLQSYSFGGNEYVRMFANYDGGSLAAITPYGNTDIPFYDRNRIAVSLRSDGWSTYLNGVKLTNQSASTSISWDNVNKVDFNSTSSGSSVYGRKTYELMIFNEALSDAELITLTS